MNIWCNRGTRWTNAVRAERVLGYRFNKLTMVVCLVLTMAASAGADEQAIPRGDHQTVHHKIPLAVTVAGGVSLGAYQAGYLYYLTETAKQNQDLFEFKLLTGASAGLINAVIALLAIGGDDREATQDPTQSLFYQVWTDMTHDELLDVDDAPPGALSSRKVLERLADKMESAWIRGLTSDLDMVVGASTTRLENRTVRVGQGFDAKTLEEKFVFRVQGDGLGRPPRVSNYVDLYSGLESPVLPFAAPDKTVGGRNANFSIIRQLLFASTAIPLVFLPQQIDYCMTSPDLSLSENTQQEVCEKPQFEEYFIDGGIVDRQPLRLAYRIAKSGLQVDPSGSTWREMPDRRNGRKPGIYYLYIDPRAPTYPNSIQDEEMVSIEKSRRLFRSLGHLFKGVYRSVQSKELYTLVDENPGIRSRIQLGSHDFPALGGLLANFFSFFDREMRRFDFYLGMRDAHRFVEEQVPERLKDLYGESAPRPKLPGHRLPVTKADVHTGWHPYYCLLSELDGTPDLKDMCQGHDMIDFRILTQVTLDRLYDHCRRFPFDPTLKNEHCRAAMAGSPPPRKIPLVSANDWQRDDDSENTFEHAMRLLGHYGFEFADLGLDRDDSEYGLSRVRAELLNYMDSFAKKLRWGDGMALRILGKPAINLLAYAPPEVIIYFIMGTGAELGLSATLRRLGWLRFNIGIQTKGFNLFLASAPNAYCLTPQVGFEVEPLPLSMPLLQTRIGVRMGYQFSTDDDFLFGKCRKGRIKQNSLRCSAPVAQAFVGFVFFERVRLQLGLEWFPKWLPPMTEVNKHLFAGIVEVGWQWISPF